MLATVCVVQGVTLAGAELQSPSELVLDGNDWTVADFDPGQGVTQKAFSNGYPASQAIAAVVPGDVHWDLERAGKLPSLFYGENSRAEKIGWVWQKEWWYRKSFRVPEAWRSREVRLHFDGVDYECEVWLNEQRLGRHEGAFTPFEFEISKQLRFGEDNIVTVQVHPVPASLAGADSPPPEFRPAYSYTKGESELGWDFAPKIMNLGIEKNVKLISSQGAFLFQPLVFPKLSPPYDKAELQTMVEVQADHPQTLELRYQVRLLDGGGAGTFDFVFIDADKFLYKEYYEAALILLRKGGVVAVDNVLWDGRAEHPPPGDTESEVIHSLNELIKQDPRVDACMLGIADGVYLARKL
jgi:hypothetical protein